MIKERKPNRLQGYDYSSDNLYFVTSCVHNRVCCFGEIGPDNPVSSVGTGRDLSLHHNGENNSAGTGRDPSLQMILNEYGKIAEQQWYWLQEQYPYIVLHAFVIMPNHIHGIIEINRNIVGMGRDPSLRLPYQNKSIYPDLWNFNGNVRFMNISFAMKNLLKQFPITF